jgi:sulfur-carrier protein adenylyltransferase/sulfurtransferase
MANTLTKSRLENAQRPDTNTLALVMVYCVNNDLGFPYDLAFDRNLGFITDFEQLALRAKRVAIAGMGGVGGVHLLTLARLGIGCFTIADFDQFEFANFNRQAGATVPTVGHDKTVVLEDMAHAINPELRIRRMDAGVTPDSIDDFLKDADLFVDGLDFFALPIRRQIFARCADLGIPAVTAAPIGMGAAFIAFDPKGMTFDQYFRLNNRTEHEQHLRFLIGLSPRILASRYLVDPARVDLARHKGPSSIAACQLCAGVTAVAALKLLLARGNLKSAPHNYQFDPYVARFHVSQLRFGNAGPLQRVKLAVARRRYGRVISHPPAPEPFPRARSPVEEILNLARWAPSGDNVQPWRFRILDADTVRVTVQREPDNVYEYRDGEPTWLSVGILIETMRIAGTAWQRNLTWERAPSDPSETITVRFSRSDTVAVDPLLSLITLRSVERRPYRRRPLTTTEKAALQSCLSGDLILDWHESLPDRWRIAKVAAAATSIRLRCPEGFPIHQRVIDWDHAHSSSGIPANCVGLSGVSLPLMRWALQKLERAQWLNRLDGTLTTSLQMDLLPGLGSAAYFVMRRPSGQQAGAATPADLIEMGRGIQRFWLTATRLGLAVQPILATIAFSHYGERKIKFSAERGLCKRAESLARSFNHVLGITAEDAIFIGRIGEPYPRLPTHRSVRRPLEELLT